MSGISLDGVVEFALEKGIYDIEIDQSTLPEGYYIPEDKEFVTEPEKANVEVNIPSRVISHPARVFVGRVIVCGLLIFGVLGKILCARRSARAYAYGDASGARLRAASYLFPSFPS